MPLIHKPRNPSYGVRKVRRKLGKRKKLHASILPETKSYLDEKCTTMASGRLIDDAVKLYINYRYELQPIPKTDEKRQAITAFVSSETLFYFQFMSSAMNHGELLDEVIRLYRKRHE